MVKKARKTKRQALTERITASSGNVFADFGYPNPEEANTKSDLAFLIRSIIKQKNLTQEQIAELMGIDQPKVSKIMRGILSEFTIERLMKYLVTLGYDVKITATQSKTRAPTIHVGKANTSKRATTRL